MAISIISVGTVANGFNTGITAVAGSDTAGDGLLLFTGEFLGSDTIATPAGWTLLSANVNTKQNACFALLATGSDSIPTISWGNQFAWAVVIAIRGMDQLFNPGFNVVDRASTSTTIIVGQAVNRTPTADGSIVFAFGSKNKTATSNGTVFSPPTNFTIAAQQAQGGVSPAFAIGYWIQTTATIVPSGGSGFSGSIADGTAQATQGSLFSILAQPSGIPPGDQEYPDKPYPILARQRKHEFWQMPLELLSIPPATPPPPSVDLSLPTRRQFPTSIFDQVINEMILGTDRVLLPVSWDYEWDKPELPVSIRVESQGLGPLEFFTLSNFPPYIEYNWPVPLRAKQPLQGYEFSVSLNLIGKDKLPTAGFQNNMWDPPQRRPFPTVLRSLEQSGLALYNTVPLKPPLSEANWPVPLRPRRFVQDQATGTPTVMLAYLTTFPPSTQFQELPVRPKRSAVYSGYTYSSLPLLNASSVQPPGNFIDLPVHFRRRRRNDIYQISERSVFLVPPVPPPPTQPGQTAGPGGRTILMPKKQGETVNRPFDFISRLGPNENLLSAVVFASVYSGTDLNPQAIIFGSASITGTIVNQGLTAGVLGVVYELLCKVTTSLGQTLEISAFWVIEPDLP